MNQEIKETIGIAYERFLMRDLTYMLSGLISIISVKFNYDGNITEILIFIGKENDCNFCIFILFLIISYFVGLLSKEGLQFIKIKNKSNSKTSLFFTTKIDIGVIKPYNDQIIFRADVIKFLGFEVSRRLERVTYFFHIGAAIGTASLIGITSSMIFFLFRFFGFGEDIDIIPHFSLLIFLFGSFVISIKLNESKISEYNNHAEIFVDKILEKKEYCREKN